MLRTFQAHCAAFLAPHAACGRTTPAIAINFFRAIHRFDNAKSVSTCAVFFATDRNLTCSRGSSLKSFYSGSNYSEESASAIDFVAHKLGGPKHRPIEVFAQRVEADVVAKHASAYALSSTDHDGGAGDPHNILSQRAPGACTDDASQAHPPSAQHPPQAKAACQGRAGVSQALCLALSPVGASRAGAQAARYESSRRAPRPVPSAVNS